MQNPNDKIVTRLYKIIKEHTADQPEYAHWLNIPIDSEGNFIDSRLVPNKIIEAFPWPIGVEMRRLFSGERREQNKERLEQVLKVAEKSTQFLALILIAQLWDEVKSKKVIVSADFNNQFNGFDKPSFGIWAGLIRSIHSIFENQSVTPFTEHIASIYFSNKAFIKQMERLVQIRNDLMHYNEMPDPNEVEEALTDFLCSISFLIKYTLVAVSKIEVRKSRLTKVMYDHSLRILKSQHDDFSMDDKSFESFFESPAVMLFKDFKSGNDHLNLSPLLIDTSTLVKTYKSEGIKQGVYVYNGIRNDNFNYYFTSGHDSATINNLPFFKDLENEFKDLKATLKYEKPL
jgi:hypothetical protein